MVAKGAGAPAPREQRERQDGVQKGGLAAAVQAVVQSHPDAIVEVWGEDEARIGLIPLGRRVWGPVGTRPKMCSRRRYQWKYVFGFVHPASGQTEWWITSTVSGEGMTEVLRDFAAVVGAGPGRRIVLVLDGAGWHTAQFLVVPEGIHLVFQPAYSPELQPAEQLWPLLNEPLANRDFIDLDELVDLAGGRCNTLSADRATIRARTNFHWWPPDYQPRVERAAS